MFKARGTRIIETVDAPSLALPVREPDTRTATMAATTDQKPTTTRPEVSPPPVEITETIANNAGDTPHNLVELPESFGLPAMPVDFLDQVRAAQAGDLAAIEIVREIGAMVPEDRRILFMMHVQTLLDERESAV